MLAKKCDRCGRYFDHYGNNEDTVSPNGIYFAYFDREEKISEAYVINKKPRKYSLCPECMSGLEDYIFGSEVKA